ncbi:MAG TPA: bifunctional nuclease domain-containing protein [Gaiellaceae bacterium]
MRKRTDSELVAAVREGDRAGFAELLDRHERSVRAVTRRLLGETDAEDVTQEAFLQAYLGLGRLRDPGRFGAWLTAIAVNLAKMRLRERRVVVPLDEDPAADGGRDSAEASELISWALDVLPAREHEAVLLYYVEGLSSAEVAALTGERPGTVRVRLHRARRRLRARLEPFIPQAGKEKTMVEVIVQDVVVRAATRNGGEAEVVSDRRIVLLKEKSGERILPIWVGPPEGDALALELGGEARPRPMTVDLMATLLEAAGATVERVEVNSLRESTFYATIVLGTAGGTQEVDARPSDALNLAVRVGAPIFVDDAVMEHAFTGDLEEKVREEQDRLGLEPEAEGDWRSLSPEMVKALHPPFPTPK